MSDSVRPHRWQPTRLLYPWDSPGKNTGTGCHALLHRIFPTHRSNPGLPHGRRILYHLSHQACLRVLEWDAIAFSDGLYSQWNSPGQNTGVGSLSLLRGIFPTQGLNPGLLHCRWILYQLSHEGSPRILEWVAFPFSRESSQPRHQTRVSCIAGRFFTN